MGGRSEVEDRDQETRIAPEDVLRRMLNTPPQPDRVPKKKKIKAKAKAKKKPAK